MKNLFTLLGILLVVLAFSCEKEGINQTISQKLEGTHFGEYHRSSYTYTSDCGSWGCPNASTTRDSSFSNSIEITSISEDTIFVMNSRLFKEDSSDENIHRFTVYTPGNGYLEYKADTDSIIFYNSYGNPGSINPTTDCSCYYSGTTIRFKGILSN